MNDKRRLLIVDDTPHNLRLLRDILRDDYAISLATNGPDALVIAARRPIPDLILLDVMMPAMDGYEVCEKLKSNPATQFIPIIFITALTDEGDEERGLRLGAADFITKPITPAIVQARVRNHMELKIHRDNLEKLVTERTRELQLTRDVTLLSLAGLAETRDNETGAHILRTKKYVAVLARALARNHGLAGELSEERICLIEKTSPLHDIGKVGIPDSILLKPGKLTAEEFEEMKLHTVYGRNAILNAEKHLDMQITSDFLLMSREIAYYHHERWDGNGYPKGLVGEEIPLSARLMAVADVYDALVSKRIYKPAMPHGQAVEIIRDGSGSQFDPLIVEAFLEVEPEFEEIARKYQD